MKKYQLSFHFKKYKNKIEPSLTKNKIKNITNKYLYYKNNNYLYQNLYK